MWYELVNAWWCYEVLYLVASPISVGGRPSRLQLSITERLHWELCHVPLAAFKILSFFRGSNGCDIVTVQKL